jgi:hypothetical protein
MDEEEILAQAQQTYLQNAEGTEESEGELTESES